MPFVQRHADFGVALESAKARAMSGTRVDDDDGGLSVIDTIFDVVFMTTRYPQQSVIGRALEVPRVENGFIFKVERHRHTRFLMRQHVVGPFTQYIEEQHAALPAIGLVAKCLLDQRRR